MISHEVKDTITSPVDPDTAKMIQENIIEYTFFVIHKTIKKFSPALGGSKTLDMSHTPKGWDTEKTALFATYVFQEMLVMQDALETVRSLYRDLVRDGFIKPGTFNTYEVAWEADALHKISKLFRTYERQGK